MADMMKTGKRRELKRWMDNMKAVKTGQSIAGTGKYTAPTLQAVKLPRITAPKLPKLTVKPAFNEKSANMFYTNPVNRGTISNVKSVIGVKPASSVKPTANVKPKSLAEFQKEIAARQQAIADLDRQQYHEMLKGSGKVDQLEALKGRHEWTLKELQTGYAQAMGLNSPQHSRMSDEYREAMERRMQEGNSGNQSLKGFLRKQATKGGSNTANAREFQQLQYAQPMGLNSPQHSRMSDEYREAVERRMQEGSNGQQSLKDILGQISGSTKPVRDNEDKSFWDGFRKGLGLKDGEEIGGGRPGDISFAATDVAAHKPGLYQDDNKYTREQLEERRRALQEELIELLLKHGYTEDEITGELLNDLLYNGTGLGEDQDEFRQLTEEIEISMSGLFTYIRVSNWMTTT